MHDVAFVTFICDAALRQTNLQKKSSASVEAEYQALVANVGKQQGKLIQAGVDASTITIVPCKTREKRKRCERVICVFCLPLTICAFADTGYSALALGRHRISHARSASKDEDEMGAAARSDISEDEGAEDQDEQGAEGERNDGSSTDVSASSGDDEEEEEKEEGEEEEEVAVDRSGAPLTVAKEAARSSPRKTVQRHDTVSAPLTQAPSTGVTRKRLGEDDTTVKAKKHKAAHEPLADSDFAVEDVTQQKKPKSGSGKVTTVCLRLFYLHCTMSFVRHHADF